MKNAFSIRTAIVAFLLISSIVFIQQYNHLLHFTKESLGKYFDFKWILYPHIIPGGAALLIGPTQLIKEIRNKSLKLHRILGKAYLICILISATGAFTLTFFTTNTIGYMYTLSILFMLAAWVCSTSIAYWSIRRRMIFEHQQWMTRSYMVTFAFVVQNYILKIDSLMALGSFAEVSPNIFWFSWTVPLFGYQVYLTLSASNKKLI